MGPNLAARVLPLLLAVTASSCTDDFSPFSRRPVPGRDLIPTLFGAGIISSEAPEFAISFTPDGNTVYFNRVSADRSELKIMESRRVEGRWSEPVTVSFSGAYRDVDPFVTPDGRRLYFSSDRPREGTDVKSFSTWYMARTEAGWSEPIDPGEPVNSDSSDVFASVAADGTLWVSSLRDGTQRVYFTREEEDGWSEPEPVVFGDVESAGNPLISRGGSYVIIVNSTQQGLADLFVSCRANDAWLTPLRLPEHINSDFADFAPALSSAGDMLYFTSERPGIVEGSEYGERPPGDLYQIAFGNPCQH